MNDKKVFSYKLNCNKVITLLQSRVDLNCNNARKCNTLISWFKKCILSHFQAHIFAKYIVYMYMKMYLYKVILPMNDKKCVLVQTQL